MPALDFRFKVDAAGPIEYLSRLLPSRTGPAIKKGAGTAAFRIQQMMREELERLVYSTPESPTYQRTRTLWRATYAARPGGDHSRDHDAAFAGHDLAVTEPVAGGVVVLRGYEAEIDIGSWADWAYYVHEGLGGNATRGPRPFTAVPLAAAPAITTEEISRALAVALAGSVR